MRPSNVNEAMTYSDGDVASVLLDVSGLARVGRACAASNTGGGGGSGGRVVRVEPQHGHCVIVPDGQDQYDTGLEAGLAWRQLRRGRGNTREKRTLGRWS